jgi:peptidoglycan/LPS O-acetylase OafA/YrhL
MKAQTHKAKTAPTESAKQDEAKQQDHAFLVLDGLRGVAAISVVVYHYMFYITDYGRHGLPNAFLAVDFFFVLSGFIIAYTYEKRLLAGHFVGQFMLRRLIRLYPLYWLGMTLPLLIVVAKIEYHNETLAQLLNSYPYGLLFLPTPHFLLSATGHTGRVTTEIFPANGVAWTLSLEIGVNFIYALICHRLTTPRLAILTFMGGLGVAIALWFYGHLNIGWNWSTYLGGWARVVFCRRFFVSALSSQRTAQTFPSNRHNIGNCYAG